MMNNNGADISDRPMVLLLEDDAGVRRSLQLLLQGKGVQVRSFASGSALLADPSADRAACLVSDYRMPDIDGIALLAALRERGWTAPAVLITAFPSQALVREALETGYRTVLEKPLFERGIGDLVARLLVEHASAAPRFDERDRT